MYVLFIIMSSLKLINDGLLKLDQRNVGWASFYKVRELLVVACSIGFILTLEVRLKMSEKGPKREHHVYNLMMHAHLKGFPR
jgi:hypothetical protein